MWKLTAFTLKLSILHNHQSTENIRRNTTSTQMVQIRKLRHVVFRRHCPLRNDLLLRHLRLLHPPPVVVQNMGTHPRLVQYPNPKIGRGKLLLSHVCKSRSSREGEGSRGGICTRGGLGDKEWGWRIGRSHCCASHE